MRYRFDCRLDQHRGSGNDFHLVYGALRRYRGFKNDCSFNAGPLSLRWVLRLLDVDDPGLLDVAADADRRGWRWKNWLTARSAKHSSQNSAGVAGGSAPLHAAGCAASNARRRTCINNPCDVFRYGHRRCHLRFLDWWRLLFDDGRRLGNRCFFHDMALRARCLAQGRRGRGWRSRHI